MQRTNRDCIMHSKRSWPKRKDFKNKHYKLQNRKNKLK